MSAVLSDVSDAELIAELRRRRMMARAKQPPHRCEDCEQPAPPYMARNEVWAQAWPGEAHERARRRKEWHAHGTGKFWCILCFSCLANRLGRPLVETDFDFSLPINWPIQLGLNIARR